MKAVRYSDFGAKGDGRTDDLEAIAKAHAHANAHDLPVRADENATYYIGGRDMTAVIQTDTDFTGAKFVIDDTQVEDRNARVFEVRSKLPAIKLTGIERLKKDQAKIDLKLEQACLLIIMDADTKRYIRFGLNQNKGASQADVLLVDKDGNIDPKTPVLWDFDQVTQAVAHPVDPTPLRITGGHFTTIANQAESKYTYYARGIGIKRSNVIVDGLQRDITGEGAQGAPYGGFIHVSECANVTIKNTRFTAHKTYRTIGAAGAPVSMGSYDLSLNRALNVSLIDCSQSTDIHDSRYWGIMGSNYCKNLTYERCTFSRFDAHQGVFNATIRDSTLGYMGVQLIGRGTFLMENTTVHANSLVNLRPDYGSTWEGEVVIRNCVLAPRQKGVVPCVITGSNSGQHDFGYVCHMPARITIDKLRIDDANPPDKYAGPAIFGNFNRDFTDASYVEKFPYVRTREVILKDITTTSGQPLRVSDNGFMFKDVQITADPAPAR